MEPVVRVESVHKKYSRNADSHLRYGITDLFREILGQKSEVRLRQDEFLAVNHVSFNLFPGDTFGLIGRNGSGKTTLLKMLTGLTKPDAGQIAIRGRVQALINLGAGFNPRLSGRENIYNSAALMGLTRRETTGLIDEIIEFSDLQEFINSPLYTYSSGMKSRLGFSVAVSLKPEILLIDEILAVGDYAFQNRCFTRMQQLKRQGVTIVLVSHAHNSVIQLCDTALWLNEGSPMHLGPSKETVRAYLDFVENQEAKKISQRNEAARKVHSSPPGTACAGSSILPVTDAFGNHEGGLPAGWHPLPGTDLDRDMVPHGEQGLAMAPPRGSDATGFEYFLPDMTTHIGDILEVNLEALAEEPERLGLNLYFTHNGRPAAYSRNHPGDGSWTALTHKITLPDDIDPESLRLLVRLRAGATQPAFIRNVSVIARRHGESQTTDKTESPVDPYDGLYGPIHAGLDALGDLHVGFRVDGTEADYVPMHRSLEVYYAFTLRRPVDDLNITLKFFRKDGLHLSTISTLNGDLLRDTHDRRVACTCTIRDFDFNPGVYVLVIAVHEGKSYLYRNVVKEFAVSGSSRFTWGIRDLNYTYTLNGSTIYDSAHIRGSD